MKPDGRVEEPSCGFISVLRFRALVLGHFYLSIQRVH